MQRMEVDAATTTTSADSSAQAVSTEAAVNNSTKAVGATTGTAVPVNESPAASHQLKQADKQASLEDANEEIASLLTANKVSMEEVNALQKLLREHVALRDKVSKLKSLLGRSAKAQRETKMELDSSQKRLDQALREVERLSQKVTRLQNRPTHMDLLADFETNFDRALLMVGQQEGGQDSSSDNIGVEPSIIEQEEPNNTKNNLVDGMLMQELQESKSRIERLESLNAALLHRSSQLEQETKQAQAERAAAVTKMEQVQLELRMAQMQADAATKQAQQHEASLQEMQLEIDLVTKANVNAQARASREAEAAKSVEKDRQHVVQLEQQVQALSEWATASAEAKRLTMERVAILERQVKILHGESLAKVGERQLFTKTNSLVIGAGDVGFTVVELQHYEFELQHHEHMVLRWKFDVTPSDMEIDFSMLKGKCETSEKQTQASFLIENRHVIGGAAGETEHAFSVQNACTLLWSNMSSWVRPRTVKYELECVAISD